MRLPIVIGQMIVQNKVTCKKQLGKWGIYLLGKLQIASLKFEGIRILHHEISEFEFYPLKFGVIGFYTLTIQIFPNFRE